MQYWQIFSSCLTFCCYFTRLKACEISCKIWETRKYFPYCTRHHAITTTKHKWYMRKYRVKQDLIVLKLDSVSIKKILVTKFVTVKVSQNLNLMQSLTTQWNQHLIRYLFSRVIECLEQSIRKQSDCKRPSNTRQMNWVQKIQIEMRKYKAIECFEI